MHMEVKKSALRYAVVLPVIFLIMYLLFILLTEGNYIYEVLKLRRLSGIFNILIHNKVRFAPFILHFK
jgi:cytochrome c oxidase subunit IV